MTTPIRRQRALHLRLGRRGEKRAAALIKERGGEVLCTNIQYPGGELDIVAREHLTLCFIEVKTRRRPMRGRPGEAVGPGKKRRIVQLAHRYLGEISRPSVPYRFDIVEVWFSRTGFRLEGICHHRGAFTEQQVRTGWEWEL